MVGEKNHCGAKGGVIPGPVMVVNLYCDIFGKTQVKYGREFTVCTDRLPTNTGPNLQAM